MALKILFIGCVKSSEILLRALIKQKCLITAVITKENSNYNADFCSLDKICLENKIDFLNVKDINSPDSIQFMRKYSPDVIYCFGWSQLISEEVIKLAPLGAVGFHPAALPYNRGRHPLIWALVLGLEETASTFFKIDAKADTGDILIQKKIKIDYEDDARTLYKKVMDVAQDQIIQITDELARKTIIQKKQDTSKGNEWRKRGIFDGEIDWRMSSRAIYNLVRALTKPYVGAHYAIRNQKIKVWRVEEIELKDVSNIEPGKILKVNSQTDYYVKAYDNVIHVLESDRINLKEGEYL